MNAIHAWSALIRDVSEYPIPSTCHQVKQFTTSRCHAQFNSSISIIQYLFYQFIQNMTQPKTGQIQQQQRQRKRNGPSLLLTHPASYGSIFVIKLNSFFSLFSYVSFLNGHIFLYVYYIIRRHLRPIRATSHLRPVPWLGNSHPDQLQAASDRPSCSRALQESPLGYLPFKQKKKNFDCLLWRFHPPQCLTLLCCVVMVFFFVFYFVLLSLLLLDVWMFSFGGFFFVGYYSWLPCVPYVYFCNIYYFIASWWAPRAGESPRIIESLPYVADMGFLSPLAIMIY